MPDFLSRIRNSATTTTASIGGDVAFKQRRALSRQRGISLIAARARSRAVEPRPGSAGVLRLQHAPIHHCRTGRALRSRVPDGYRVHQPRRRNAWMAVSGAELLSLTSELPMDQEDQPVRVGDRRGRSQAERHRGSSLLPAVRFNFTRAGYLRVDYGTGHETFAGQKFETGRMMVDGGVQIMRWLNIGGGTTCRPGDFL